MLLMCVLSVLRALSSQNNVNSYNASMILLRHRWISVTKLYQSESIDLNILEVVKFLLT